MGAESAQRSNAKPAPRFESLRKKGEEGYNHSNAFRAFGVAAYKIKRLNLL